jgi:purine-binding chemotaxis protein CheW
VRVLLLPVAGEAVAVDLAALRVVMASPQLFPIPTAPGMVLGAVNVRGEVVPVLDTARLLGIGDTEIGFAVVVDHPMGAVALAGEGQPRTAVLGELVAPAHLQGAVGTYTMTGTGDVATLVDVAALVEPVAA